MFTELGAIKFCCICIVKICIVLNLFKTASHPNKIQTEPREHKQSLQKVLLYDAHMYNALKYSSVCLKHAHQVV